jgi:hypothetical protein
MKSILALTVFMKLFSATAQLGTNEISIDFQKSSAEEVPYCNTSCTTISTVTIDLVYLQLTWNDVTVCVTCCPPGCSISVGLSSPAPGGGQTTLDQFLQFKGHTISEVAQVNISIPGERLETLYSHEQQVVGQMRFFRGGYSWDPNTNATDINVQQIFH